LRSTVEAEEWERERVVGWECECRSSERERSIGREDVWVGFRVAREREEEEDHFVLGTGGRVADEDNDEGFDVKVFLV
jgi:hypothetical protein